MAKKQFYVFASYMENDRPVWVGKIYSSWADCEKAVVGKSHADFKGFVSRQDAIDYCSQQRKAWVAITNTKIQAKPKPIRLSDEESLTLTDEQKTALDVLMSGQNSFVTGNAGTGKSVLLRRFAKKAKEADKRVLICAPTGIAAINVGGVTIHRAFSAPSSAMEKNYPVSRTNLSFDVIIMDEVSMCRMDLFAYVVRSIRHSERKTGRNIQFVVFGDFYQLPPVVQNTDAMFLRQQYPDEFRAGYAFESQEWKAEQFTVIQLRQVVRQANGKFVRALNQARVGDKGCIEYLNNSSQPQPLPNGIYLAGRNKTVNDYNEQKLAALTEKEVIYKAQCSGDVTDRDKVAPEKLRLKPGCRVMTLCNDPQKQYQNGSLGTVTMCGKSSVNVHLDNGKDVSLGAYIWIIQGIRTVKDKQGNEKLEVCAVGTYNQIPLKLAYAVTIHKSQGQTFDNINLSPDAWEAGQLYIALSRVRSIQGLYLEQGIRERALKVSPLVTEFYRRLDTNKAPAIVAGK